MIWQPEHDNELKRLWSAGRSASQIAIAMGCGVSRSAVIGRVHRLGLSGRAARTPATVSPKKEAPIVNGGALIHALRAKAERKAPAPKQPAKPKPQPRPEPVLDVTAEELTDLPADQSDCAGRFLDRTSGCCWPLNSVLPIGEHMVCNAARDGERPYCARHARIAYAPSQTRAMTDEERERRRQAVIRRSRGEYAEMFG